MKICQKTKHELSFSAHAWWRGSLRGAIWDTREAQLAQEPAQTPTSPMLSCWAEESLKLLIDFAKTAIYISKSFCNKLLFQLTCRWKVLAFFFPKPDFVAANEDLYSLLCINRSLKRRDQAVTCNVLCSSSGTKWTHLQEKAMCRAQGLGLDLCAGIGRGWSLAQACRGAECSDTRAPWVQQWLCPGPLAHMK